MIEIIALIVLTKKMGVLALQKGLKPGMWKLYTVLAWFGAEFAGIVIGLALFGSEGYVPAILIGLGCAISSYYFLNKTLHNKPDLVDDLDDFGKTHEN